jgi:hypothetical protein
MNSMVVPHDNMINGESIEEWLDKVIDEEKQEHLTESFFVLSEAITLDKLDLNELQELTKKKYQKSLREPNRSAKHYDDLFKIIWMYDQYVQLLLKEKQ